MSSQVWLTLDHTHLHLCTSWKWHAHIIFPPFLTATLMDSLTQTHIFTTLQLQVWTDMQLQTH